MKRKILNYTKWLFYMYIIILVIVVIVKFNGSINELEYRVLECRANRAHGNWNVNLVPMRTIKSQLNWITEWWAFKNIVGNIALFVPFGLFIPSLYERYRKFGVFFTLNLAFISSVEIFQLISMLGSCDIDDVILNMIGCILGYMLFVALKQYIPKKQEW